MNSRRSGVVRRIAAAVLGLLLCAAAIAAQAPAKGAVTLPETAAGRRMAAFLAAFNTGDAAAVRKFIAENYAQSALAQRPADVRSRFFVDFYADTRGFDVRRVLESDERRIRIVVQDRLVGDWRQLGLDLEPEAPHGMLGLMIQPALPPADARPSGKLTDADVAREMSEYMKKLVAADRFSGTVLVSRNGQSIFQGAWGLASKAWKQPNRLDTKFNLGSMNKMVTAVAIAQLAEQGKLSFDDKVGKFLTDYPNADVREKVTIHHLLTHTSGVPDYFNDKYDAGAKERYRTVQDFVDLFKDQPLRFEPGSQWRYSNGNFMLLGAIVEKVAGQNYFDFVREHIYKPAKMTNTDAYEMDRDTPNLAIGYTRNCPGGAAPGERCNNLYLHVVKGGPAGGGFSTVEDLVRFAEALTGNKLLSAKYTEIVTTGKVHPDPEDQNDSYAYGFSDRREYGVRVVGHGGGFDGINGNLDIYMDGSGYVVAVLANYDPPTATRVANKVRTLIAQR
jgi:CubicO group peptidase (beta-lactamase class C family)